MRSNAVPLLILAWPLLEIAGFIVIGAEIGVIATIGFIVLSAVAGAILLRIQGLDTIARIRTEVEAGRDPGRDLAHGVMIVLAGLLLVLPGFISTAFGILLFIPTVRDLAWRLLKRRVDFSTGFAWSSRGRFRERDDSKTIDLEEDEYSRPPRNRPPRRRIDGE